MSLSVARAITYAGEGYGIILGMPFVLFGLMIGAAALYSVRKRWSRVLDLTKRRRIEWLGVWGALMIPFAFTVVAVLFFIIIVLLSARL